MMVSACHREKSISLQIPACSEPRCVSAGVPGKIFPVKQAHPYSCWAAVLTMICSWKEQTALDVEKTMSRYGDKYAALYHQSRIHGISVEDEIELYGLANLEIMRQLNPSIDGWAQFINDYGPLSITIDSRPPEGGTIHALLLVGIRGTIDGQHTDVYYIDPLDGELHVVSFMEFLKKYEAHFAVDWPIQVIHAPKNL